MKLQLGQRVDGEDGEFGELADKAATMAAVLVR